tara:strand:+ start:1290 stop:3410 length:2121 start_codon:yes stop_codon:yes gene_type:complete
MGKYSNKVFASGIPEGSIKAESLDAIRRSEGEVGSENPADISTIFKSSFPRTVSGRLRIFAKNRFPDEPLNVSTQRYGYDKEGRIYYVDDDGSLQYENPPPTVTDRGIIGGLRQIPESIASTSGTALNVASGLPAMATPPPIAIPLAGALSAGGEALRQKKAEDFGGGEGFNPAMMALEGTIGSVGQGLGEVVTKGINATRFATDATQLNKQVPYGSLSDPNMRMTRGEASQRVGQGSEKFDVPLTLAEQTGLPSLISRQKTLMSYPQASELLDNFYNIRNTKVKDALYTAFDSISPSISGSQIRGEAVDVANGILLSNKKALQKRARPFYQKAEEITDVDITPLITELKSEIKNAKGASKGALQRALKLMQVSYKEKGKTITVPDTTLSGLDAASKEIYDMTQSLAMNKKNLASNTLTGINTRLIKTLEDISPNYKQARSIYADGMPGITKQKEGVIGEISKLKGRREMNVTDILFNPKLSDAATVRGARNAFLKSGSEAEWNGVVRSWLQETLESIPLSRDGSTVNVGGGYRTKLVGDPRKAKILKEALGDNAKIKDVFWLMDTIAATGRASRKESFTAFATQAQKDIEVEASGFVAPMIETLEVWKVPSRTAGYLKKLRLGKYTERLAEVLTTKSGSEAMKELTKLSPTSRSAIVALTGLLTKSGFEKGLNEINKPSQGMLPPIESPRETVKQDYSSKIFQVQ